MQPIIPTVAFAALVSIASAAARRQQNGSRSTEVCVDPVGVAIGDNQDLQLQFALDEAAIQHLREILKQRQ